MFRSWLTVIKNVTRSFCQRYNLPLGRQLIKYTKLIDYYIITVQLFVYLYILVVKNSKIYFKKTITCDFFHIFDIYLFLFFACSCDIHQIWFLQNIWLSCKKEKNEFLQLKYFFVCVVCETIWLENEFMYPWILWVDIKELLKINKKSIRYVFLNPNLYYCKYMTIMAHWFKSCPKCNLVSKYFYS